LKEEDKLSSAVDDGGSSRTMLMALMAGAGQTKREIVE
jgi:hypothetical protein